MNYFSDELGNKIKINKRTLLIFIDETGEESLSDPEYPIFGMGGCMLPASLYISNIINPWFNLKNKEFNGQDKVLHATDLRNPTTAQIEILNNFFCSNLFERINHIAQNTDFEDIVIIFEEAERTKNINADLFDRYKLKKNRTDVKIRKFNMLKSNTEPGLEVADFIIHTAGTSVRDRLSGKRSKEKERKDFEKVFKEIDKRLSSFFEITKVENR